MQRGSLVRRIKDIHDQYGPMVRVAPDEISFIDAAAGRDIYAARQGQPRFPKNPVWMGDDVPRGNSIVSANEDDHSKIRRVWGRAFSEAALKDQEPVVQQFVGKFIVNLRERATNAADGSTGGTVNIVEWLNFLMFDLTSDLSFGESFGCLEKGEVHPWMAMIFSHFKSSTLIASIRFYPYLYKLLVWSLPKKVLKEQQEHFRMSCDKVQRRLNSEKSRPDFLQHVLEHRGSAAAGLTEAEIEKTAATMIVAGSETTATLLTAILCHLVDCPHINDRLSQEIRSAYNDEEEMTPASLIKLPYLGAVIQETLRIAPPVPTGMPRIVPPGGAFVCGQWLPENVRYFLIYRKHRSEGQA